jgi:hypothetical protein
MKKTIVLSLILVLIVATPAFAREKTDVILLTNGDRVTGEIKQLEHGILRLSTDSLGEVRIEWDDIIQIESDFAFQFERSDGTRVTGIIRKTAEQKSITLESQDQSLAFAHQKIVRIAQIEDSFWQRLQGSMSFGYSFTKASNVAQGNLGFRASHRTEKRSLSLEGSTIITSDQENEGTQRTNLSFIMTGFRPNRWFNTYLIGFESNDELGLDLRSSIGAGFGRYLVQTNISELALMGGLLGTAESLQQDPFVEKDPSSQESLEGMFGLEYSRYVYDHPAVDLSARLSAFPSITESGRTRAQLDFSLRWEVITDLFWDMSYYNTYDSDPPSSSKSTSDHGIVTSIGYSF